MSKLISKVKSLLVKYGFDVSNCDFRVSKINKNYFEIIIDKGERNFWAACFENGDGLDKMAYYMEMEKVGTNTAVVLCKNELVVIENEKMSTNYRSLSKCDLLDETVVTNIAEYFKKLHQCDVAIFDKSLEKFSLSNVLKIRDKYDLYNNKYMNFLIDNFDYIYKKSIGYFRFVCSGFCSLDYFNISLENKGIFYNNVVDYCCFSRINDLEIFCSFLDENMKEKFWMVYGEIDDIENKTVHSLKAIINLCKYCDLDNCLSICKDDFKEICNDNIFYELVDLVNWY
jgi:hypothetical protein